jgi:hypothetical protein
MPDMIPVADHIIPPNPMQGINTLSGIIGIRQAQQNLQTGKYLQQQAQAQATVEQQSAKENQGLAALMSDPVKGGVVDQYGEPTPAARERILSVAPTTGMQHYDNLIKAATNKVLYQNAWLGLTHDVRADLSARLAGSVAANDATIEDPKRAINTARSDYKGTPNESLVNRLAGIAEDSIDTVAPEHGMAGVRNVINGYSRGALSNAQISGVGGIGLPGATTNAANAIVNRSPIGGAISAPPGAPPGSAINPNAPQVAGASAQATGGAGIDVGMFGKITAAGNDASRGIELAQRIKQEASMVRTGKYTGEFANRLTVLQQHDPSITARQLLQKDTENLKSLAESTATTDQERAQIGGGFPSPDTMDPDAVTKAANYWEGSFRMAGARRDNAIAHVSQNGTAGLAVRDSQFMSTASPGKFAPPEPKKAMPSGPKLKAYADTHFNGDTAKASAFLKKQGYE